MANTSFSYKSTRSRSMRRRTNQQNKKSVRKTSKTTVTKKSKNRSRSKSRIKKGGMEHGQEDDSDTMNIMILIRGESKVISVNPESIIMDDLIEKLDIGLPHNNTKFILEGITMGGEDIEVNGSWKENGIDDGARLEIITRERSSFNDVVKDVKEMNPGVDAERLQRGANIDEHKPWHIKGDLDWESLGISQLPESFGYLRIDGNLRLDYNQLTSLPESFGSLTVGGDLDLFGNQLTSLPESFGSLTVGEDLGLNNNQLTSLPESFGSLTVGGDLSLHDNQLTSLPESFGSLTVGGDLELGDNQLTSLPESFGSLTVGGDLWGLRR